MASGSDKRNTIVALDQLAAFGRTPQAEPRLQRQGIPFWDRPGAKFGSSRFVRKDSGGEQPPFELQLPKVTAARLRAHEYVEVQDGSPWETFQRTYELKFDVFTIIAIRKASPCDLVAVKVFPKIECKELEMLQQIRHANFVAFLESFRDQDGFYAAIEYVSISLDQIVASPPYPTELQLAAILGQILNGLTYLDSQGLVHGTLACSNVLINPEGVIKISNQEYSKATGPSNHKARDLRAVGRITMELMQKYSKEDGAIGVEDLDRWPFNSNAVAFLSDTTSALSVKELNQHPLIRSPWRTEELKWLVELAALSVHRSYKYLH